ncbi:AAA family ATPase [Deinococcus sp.]|uniref:AAA family ATPase n=1 Tax=Deinococcus sp. TaxID=47478 RepID=UPI003B58BD9B
MTPIQPGFPQQQILVASDDNDFRRVVGTLRRNALLLLAGAALSGGTAYLMAIRQAPVYQATSSLIASRNDGISPFSGSVYVAPSLPRSALDSALQSRELRPRLLANLKETGRELSSSALTALTREVQAISDGDGNLGVQAVGQGQQDSGVFEITVQAATPQGAQALADASAITLLNWDASRAQQRLTQLRTNFEQQFNALDKQIELGTPASTDARRASLERQTLVAARDQVLRNLAQVAALEQTTTGNLSALASAELPTKPLSPNPARSGILAFVLSLLLLSGAVLLVAGRRRIVYDEQDMQSYGVPLLGRLPTAGSAGPLAMNGGTWQSGIDFLRINLLSQLPAQLGRQVVIASADQSEGRSSVTAALALSLAQHGERVLIVDADPRRAAQSRLWSARTLSPDGVVKDKAASGIAPSGLISVGERIDLLPTTAIRQAGGGLDLTRLESLLRSWTTHYDTVLLDTPPLLASPDAVALAAHAQGLVLIVVPGSTSLMRMEQAFEAARTVRAPVLGLLFNQRPRLSNRQGTINPNAPITLNQSVNRASAP